MIIPVYSSFCVTRNFISLSRLNWSCSCLWNDPCRILRVIHFNQFLIHKSLIVLVWIFWTDHKIKYCELLIANVLISFWYSRFDFDYLQLRLWIGLWMGLILIILVALDASAFVCYITRFTEENFATLIAFIFMVEVSFSTKTMILFFCIFIMMSPVKILCF